MSELYIEKREQDDFAVRRPGSERASATAVTVDLAVSRARELDPRANIYVERPHATYVGGRDKWRKVV